MRISKREKIYLLVLLLVVVVFLGYKFGYTKYDDYMTNLENEYDEAKKEFDEFEFSLKLKPILEEKILEYNKSIEEKSLGFAYEIKQEDLILALDDLFKANDIKIAGITFSEVTDLISLQEETSQDNAIKKIQMTLGFSAAYESVLSFIDQMQEEGKMISINNLILVSGESGTINGNMILEFYSVKNDFTFAKQKSWVDLIKYGKNNPFDASTSGGDYNIMASRSYDFLMDLRPTSSDLPTITLQKTGNEINSSLFGEANAFIDVEIHVIEEDGLYKYYYEVDNKGYPANGDYLTFNLAEDDSLGLKIFSNDRNSEVDTSGAKISIDNQTDLDFYVYIIGDDDTRPRAVFSNSGGVNIVNE